MIPSPPTAAAVPTTTAGVKVVAFPDIGEKLVDSRARPIATVNLGNAG